MAQLMLWWAEASKRLSNLSMTSCAIFLGFLSLFAGATIVLPVIGAIAQANEAKPVSVINPGFPARSFETKAQKVAKEIGYKIK